MADIYKPWQISAFSLKPINKKLISKKKDLVKVFSRKSIIQLDNESKTILINAL